MVRLASADLPNEIGLQTAPVAEEEHVHELFAPAETAYDANRYAEITPRVAGFLREARVDLGQKVKAGEVLAVVDSAEVSTAKTQYLTAQAAFDSPRTPTSGRRTSPTRQSPGRSRSSRPGPRCNQAQTTLLDAEQRLRNLRFDDAALARIPKTNDTGRSSRSQPPSMAPSSSPCRGGRGGRAHSKLYAVADISRMWLWIDVFERDIAPVEAGQAVTFTISGADPASEEPTLHGQGHLGRDRGRPDDPDDEGPGRARQPRRPAPRQPVRPGRDPARRPSTRPSSSRRRPCSATRTPTWSSCPQRRASTGRSGLRTRPIGRDDRVEVIVGAEAGPTGGHRPGRSSSRPK